MKGFICNKDGCEVNPETPPEIQTLLDQWDQNIQKRTEKRKANGCWNPEAIKCDCPACGGDNG